jgi:hypothetical protein
LADYDPIAIQIRKILGNTSYKELSHLNSVYKIKKQGEQFKAAFYVDGGKILGRLDSLEEIKDFLRIARNSKLILNVAGEFHKKFVHLAKQIPKGSALEKFKNIANKVRIMQKASPGLRKIDTSNLAEIPPSDIYELPQDKSLKATVLTPFAANHLFNILARTKEINFKEFSGGCQNRAKEMTAILNKYGVLNAKVITQGGSFTKPLIHVDTRNFKNLDDLGSIGYSSTFKGYVSWWYHIAPLVLVNFEEKILPYVMDPSLHQGPVPLQLWLDRQTSLGLSEIVSVKVVSRNVLYPLENLSKEECYPEVDQELKGNLNL